MGLLDNKDSLINSIYTSVVNETVKIFENADSDRLTTINRILSTETITKLLDYLETYFVDYIEEKISVLTDYVTRTEMQSFVTQQIIEYDTTINVPKFSAVWLAINEALSGTVLASRISWDENFVVTAEGGIGIKLVNKTGSASVKGTIVEASTTTANAFGITGVDDYMPIGAVYENGIADGEECVIIVSGKCQVLLEDTTASTIGYWVRTSETDSGRADITNAAPPGGGIPELDAHSQEMGHCLESVTAGTDKLAWINIHFN